MEDGLTMWLIDTTECFEQWLLCQDEDLRESVFNSLGILEKFGPALGRPYVDTVNDSAFTNMKELRVQHDGHPVRAFFAFDPKRHAIILCAGDKKGKNEKRFYTELIKLADSEYRKHLISLEK